MIEEMTNLAPCPHTAVFLLFDMSLSVQAQVVQEVVGLQRPGLAALPLALWRDRGRRGGRGGLCQVTAGCGGGHGGGSGREGGV